MMKLWYRVAGVHQLTRVTVLIDKDTLKNVL